MSARLPARADSGRYVTLRRRYTAGQEVLMMWKCSLTMIVGEDDRAVVVSEERVAGQPQIGFDLLWIRVKEQLSLQSHALRDKLDSVQLLGWADPILEPHRSADAVTAQRMIDSARRRDEDCAVVKLVYEEQPRLREEQATGTIEKGGTDESF